MYGPEEVPSYILHGIFSLETVKVSQRNKYLGLFNADVTMIE